MGKGPAMHAAQNYFAQALLGYFMLCPKLLMKTKGQVLTKVYSRLREYGKGVLICAKSRTLDQRLKANRSEVLRPWVRNHSTGSNHLPAASSMNLPEALI